MNIEVSEEAANWFKKEYEIENKASLRFFVRYGGGMAGNIPGFSLGVNLETPDNIHASTTVKNIEFYIEESDAWYFEEKNLVITYNYKEDEPQFEYK